MSENQKPTTAAYRDNWHTIWGTKVKRKTELDALPRRRSGAARALKDPQVRRRVHERVIPDKRRVENERRVKEEMRATALGLEPLNVSKRSRDIIEETGRKFGPAMRALAND